MKTRGIIRPMDKNGRLVLPKTILAALDLAPGDLLGIYTGYDSEDCPVVALRKHDITCPLCGTELTTENTLRLDNDRAVCRSCAKEVQAL